MKQNVRHEHLSGQHSSLRERRPKEGGIEFDIALLGTVKFVESFIGIRTCVNRWQAVLGALPCVMGRVRSHEHKQDAAFMTRQIHMVLPNYIETPLTPPSCSGAIPVNTIPVTTS